MAREVHAFTVTIPAGTPSTAPLTFTLAIPPRRVTEVQVQVPPGPRGEVGFAVAMSGRAILPYEPGAFIVTDNELVSWPLEDANTSGDWELIAYNSGTYTHSLYVRIFAELTSDAAAPVEAFADSTALSD